MNTWEHWGTYISMRSYVHEWVGAAKLGASPVAVEISKKKMRTTKESWPELFFKPGKWGIFKEPSGPGVKARSSC